MPGPGAARAKRLDPVVAKCLQAPTQIYLLEEID